MLPFGGFSAKIDLFVEHQDQFLREILRISAYAQLVSGYLI
jgi:hypothetical protein